MGKLRPIGSEKLTGTEKINRMLEIARYNENIPQSINENKSVEYSKILPDGNNYQIVKEKNGYVIKKSLNENSSKLDYLEPIKNRKYYSSYSQAFKRLNLILKEINSYVNQKNNISLFESSDEATKYILKFGETDEQDNPELAAQAPAQAPAPAPQTAPPTTPSPESQDSVEPQVDVNTDTEQETTDEVPLEDQPTETGEEQGEEVNFKTIQKLTGKLAQKIRQFSSNEENKMSSKDIKYVINSVLSALDLNSLEDEDKEQIMSKFEGGETTDTEMDDQSMDAEDETMDTDEVQSSEVETGQELVPQTPEPPQTGEMAESFDDMIVDYVKNKAVENLKNKYPKTSKFVERLGGVKDDEDSKFGEMFENLFSESKVESVLKKYFTPTSKDKNNSDIIRKNSSNIVQEVKAKKLLEKYPQAKFLGKTKNYSLVFELDETRVRVLKNGKIL